ncbi:hypothetical protein [Pseudonocardia sp. KRD291]|uniref:hypothetical protein n=1 Tax=Pseudonocardia sp. KRD291 TaxID=2792007 RepID=UPI001C4A4E2C|nr:hypothetical protein [Pseudonocardia sp. KRD291]MBW0103541.1 hypothetical protein [Pseudonocardia sp. KRD291]
MRDDADPVVWGAPGTGAEQRPGDPLTRWARGVVLGGEGHYAAAAAVLDRLRAGPGVPDAVRAHAAVTRAAHLRQLGGHRLAAALDGQGLRLARAAPGCGPGATGVAAAAVADALVGLAADAVGRWDAPSAARLLARAEPWCAPGGRPGVRWHWVRAETALLRGDPAAAVAAAGDAVRAADALGSVRHLLKSRLVAAVARSVAGDEQDPLPELDRIAAQSSAAGLLPLHRAALLAAADAADAVGGGPPREAGAGATAAERGGTVRRDGHPTRTGAPVPPNERHARMSRLNTLSRQTGAQRRRHAAAVTLNVLYLRTDPLGRRSIRESAWIPDSIAVPYGLLHSATCHPHVAQSSGDAFPDGGHKFAPTVSR